MHIDRAHRMESLEGRRMLAVTYGQNAVLNGGGETFTGVANGTNIVSVANWTTNGDPTLDVWTDSAAFSAQIPKPADAGQVFFTGGPDQQETDFFQTVDLTSIGAAIDAGNVTYNLSALLGGFSSQNDNATVFVNFQSIDHFFVDQKLVGPVTATDRSSNNGLLPRSTSGTVPADTRFAQVQIHFERSAGAYNDGYADNISLVLNQAGTPLPDHQSYDVNTRRATFTFDRALSAGSIAASDLDVLNETTLAPPTHPATAASLSADGLSAVFTLPTSLANANYQFRLPAGAVSGASGSATTTSAVIETYILAGDGNRSRSTDFDDLLLMAKNYGQLGKTFSQGNYDYSADGSVGFDDLLILAHNYRATVPPAAFLSGAAAEPAQTSVVRHRRTVDEMI